MLLLTLITKSAPQGTVEKWATARARIFESRDLLPFLSGDSLITSWFLCIFARLILQIGFLQLRFLTSTTSFVLLGFWRGLGGRLGARAGSLARYWRAGLDHLSRVLELVQLCAGPGIIPELFLIV